MWPLGFKGGTGGREKGGRGGRGGGVGGGKSTGETLPFREGSDVVVVLGG